MSYGFAGALQGVGNALQQWSAEKRAEAQRLLEMEQREEMARERMVFAQELKGRGRAGGGGRRGGGGRAKSVGGFGGEGAKKLYIPSARERDDIRDYWKAAYPDGGEDAPSLSEFEAEFSRVHKKDQSFGETASIVEGRWKSKEVTETPKVERNLLGKIVWGEKTKDGPPETRTVYGFERPAAPTKPAGGFGGSPSPAVPTAALTEGLPPAPESPAARKVGATYMSPKHGPVRWTGKGWERADG